MKKIELLAPAGNMDSLRAAAAAGCDAVYLGLTSFSARALAGNFDHDQFIEAVSFCHIRGIRVYVTVNTLLSENEIPMVMDEIRFLYEHDADAVLIQDIGLFHMVRICFPDLAVHCSTQMHIHNINGARFMKKNGADRVVLARETPLEIVKDISAEGIETEVFAYGALCISYSGECLMSSSIKNRSGNRGVCAQLCRLKYSCGVVNTDGDYLLSPRDLNVIERIPELISAGVTSLKIEGRMKRPEYVYLVVKTFREAIDSACSGKKYHVSEERKKELYMMFNRGFTEGHLFHASAGERMNHYRPNHQGIPIGNVLSAREGTVTVRLTDTLYQHDGLRILNEPLDNGLTAVWIEKNERYVNQAEKGDIVVLPCTSKPIPKPGQSLRKTTDTKLMEKISSMMQSGREIPVHAEYRICVDEPFTLSLSDEEGFNVTVQGTIPARQAEKAPLDHGRIEKAVKKSGGFPFDIVSVKGSGSGLFLPVSELNEVRRSAMEALSRKREKRNIRSGEREYAFSLKQITGNEKLLIEDYYSSRIFSPGGKCYEKMPVIHESEYNNEVVVSAVISEPGALDLKKENCIAGMNLNIANSYAAAFILAQDGIEGVVLSSELSEKQCMEAEQAFLERYGFVLPAYRFVYGRRTLMYIKDGFLPDMSSVRELEDLPGNVYPVYSHDCVSEILEPKAVRRRFHGGFGRYLIFTVENDQEKKEIEKEAYEEIFGRI